MPQDFLQAENVPTIDEITDTEGMAANMRVEFRHMDRLFHSLEQFLDRTMSHRVTIRAQIQSVLILRVDRLGPFFCNVVDQGFLSL